jgi:hypothetical protein
MRIPDYTVSSFGGMNTFIKDTKTLKPGISTTQRNWLTAKYGDHIELRRGSQLLGETREDGAGKITGLGVALRADGERVPFWSRGLKIEYYNATTGDRAEAGSDLIPIAAEGEDFWFAPYQNLAGAFMYAGSPNSGIYKIPVANPANSVNQQVSNFRWSVFRFGRGRSLAGRRNGTVAGNRDLTGAYLSHIDSAILGNTPPFAEVTGESYGTGDGSTLTFGHTLAAVSGAETAMYVSVTDGVETFTDDRSGTMIGSAGGTGTVNYATGAVSVTFAVAPLNAAPITCGYYTEDATNDGVLDFDTSVTGSGKPKVFRQDDGGRLMGIAAFLDVNYWLHELKTWALSISLDDTESTNLPYRNVGIPFERAYCETPDGILLIDTSNPNEPKVRRLEIGQNTNNLTIVPTPISDALDLTAHAFGKAVAFRWGDYEIVCCQEYVNGVPVSENSIMYVRNVYSGAWDKLDYRVSCLAIVNGALIAGDPISNNVFTLFSGFDDDEGAISNHWQDGQLNLGTDNLKVAHLMRVTGLIQKDQDIQVFLVLDDGTPVSKFLIQGDGDYVDQGINVTIGSSTIGSQVVGGGGEETAHPFDVTFPIPTARFQHVSVRFEAQGIGHAAINSYTYKDIRDKGTRSLPIKTV